MLDPSVCAILHVEVWYYMHACNMSIIHALWKLVWGVPPCDPCPTPLSASLSKYQLRRNWNGPWMTYCRSSMGSSMTGSVSSSRSAGMESKVEAWGEGPGVACRIAAEAPVGRLLW